MELMARLCRAPGGKPRQVCPGSADVDFFSYSNGSTGLRSSTPSPLLRVSHDDLWVLRDAFLWNERDPHAPAGIVSEELSELESDLALGTPCPRDQTGGRASEPLPAPQSITASAGSTASSARIFRVVLALVMSR
jgi:hypothetical protein